MRLTCSQPCAWSLALTSQKLTSATTAVMEEVLNLTDEAADFIRRLAAARARGVPPRLRRAAATAYSFPWTGIAAIASQRALASSLLELPITEDGVDGAEPCLPAVLAAACWEDQPSPSRLVTGNCGEKKIWFCTASEGGYFSS